MSWSVSKTGTPDEVVAALDEYAAQFTTPSQSSEEFHAALPHLVALVRQTYVTPDGLTENYPPKTLVFSAWGSGSTRDGKEMCRDCSVSIKLA